MVGQEVVADHIAGDQSASCTRAVGLRGGTPHWKAGTRVPGARWKNRGRREGGRTYWSKDGWIKIDLQTETSVWR